MSDNIKQLAAPSVERPIKQRDFKRMFQKLAKRYAKGGLYGAEGYSEVRYYDRQFCEYRELFMKTASEIKVLLEKSEPTMDFQIPHYLFRAAFVALEPPQSKDFLVSLGKLLRAYNESRVTPVDAIRRLDEMKTNLDNYAYACANIYAYLEPMFSQELEVEIRNMLRT